MLPGLLGGMDNFAAGVWDAYGKLRLQAGARSAVTASLLASGDRYGFDTPDASHEVMGWKNLVGLLRFRREGVRTDLDIRLSANRYGTGQVQDKQFRETADHLSLQSTLTEYILSGDLKHRLGAYVTLSEGVKLRRTQFEPGQLNERKRRTDVLLATGWLQGELAVPDLLRLKAAVRLNKYRNYDHHSVLSNNTGLVREGASLHAGISRATWPWRAPMTRRSSTTTPWKACRWAGRWIWSCPPADTSKAGRCCRRRQSRATWA